MAVYNPMPMSLYDRRKLVERLRLEAAEKVAEADRIEKGIKADEEEMVEIVRKTIKPFFNCGVGT